MSKVDFKKSTSNFPSSGVSNDTLYFKTDTNNVQMKLGNMPLRNDVVSLSFTHSIESTSTDSILETTSDYITTPYDGLKITIADISDSGTVGYRFGSNSTGISINGDAKRIYGITGADPLTSSHIEPTTVNYTLMLQYSSSLNSGSGGWMIVGQYDALPTAGGEMTGSIDMNNHRITDLADAVDANDAVAKQQAIVYDSNNDVFISSIGVKRIANVADPTQNRDVANKHYVDDKISKSRLLTIATDNTAANIDGSKDCNFVYVGGQLPAIGTITFTEPMETGKMCHIFAYGSGSIEAPGVYSTSSAYIFIPNRICVGGQSDGSSQYNYVWVNGEFVHGDTVNDSGGKYFKIPKPTSKTGMLEISVFFQEVEISNVTQYRTIIKVDGDEVPDPR